MSRAGSGSPSLVDRPGRGCCRASLERPRIGSCRILRLHLTCRGTTSISPSTPTSTKRGSASASPGRTPPRTPSNHVAFNFYPHYRVPEGDYIHLAKTLEMLRLQPSLGIERGGRHGVVKEARLVAFNGKPYDALLSFEFDADNSTALRFPLPAAVEAGRDDHGGTRIANSTCPNKQGRLGLLGRRDLSDQLASAARVLRRHRLAADAVRAVAPAVVQRGRRVPRHDHVARERSARVLRPRRSPKRSSATAASVSRREPFVGRDFAVLCSSRFKEFTSETKLPDGKTVKLRCLAFPEHEFYATEILKIVGEAIPVFSQWFGTYPYDQFTVAESYFGWNGNECAGLIMIDERVFGMPHLARGYVEYLVSHETCHQWWYNLVGTNGYSEPFMDEGAAVHFTHRLLDQKQRQEQPVPGMAEGPDVAAEHQPRELPQRRDVLRDSQRRDAPGGAGPSAVQAPLRPVHRRLRPRVEGVRHDRGPSSARPRSSTSRECWWRSIAGACLQAKDYRAELEAYTGRDYGEFFDRWVYGKGLTDWEVEKCATGDRATCRASRSSRGSRCAPVRGRGLTVVVRQNGEFTEPTTLGSPARAAELVSRVIPVGADPRADRRSTMGRPQSTPLGDEYVADQRRCRPRASRNRSTVDPDRRAARREPRRTTGGSRRRVHAVTPLYTMLDETDLTSDYDRWNFTAGPWMWGPSYNDPWYTRSTMIGLRAGVNRTQTLPAGAYLAYRTDYRDMVARRRRGATRRPPRSRRELGTAGRRAVGRAGRRRRAATARSATCDRC